MVTPVRPLGLEGLSAAGLRHQQRALSPLLSSRPYPNAERGEARLAEVDPVIARLEGAALTTARAMQEISQHWDAVYEAMRRAEQPDDDQSPGLAPEASD
jgi:hypothetical protein